jgi:hypothetical protein
MRSICFGASAGLLLFLLLISAEEGYPESTPVQRRRIDLSSSPDVQEAGPIDANTRINLAYLGQNRLAVVLLFPIRVNGRFSPVRDEETWRVLLLSVDSSEGKILHSFRFGDFHGEGANSEWLQLGVVNSDELLVIFGNELVRFSSDLVPLARRTLAREVQVRNGLHYYDRWRFLTDPTQDRAVLARSSIEIQWSSALPARLRIVRPKLFPRFPQPSACAHAANSATRLLSCVYFMVLWIAGVGVLSRPSQPLFSARPPRTLRLCVTFASQTDHDAPVRTWSNNCPTARFASRIE